MLSPFQLRCDLGGFLFQFYGTLAQLLDQQLRFPIFDREFSVFHHHTVGLFVVGADQQGCGGRPHPCRMSVCHPGQRCQSNRRPYVRGRMIDPAGVNWFANGAFSTPYRSNKLFTNAIRW